MAKGGTLKNQIAEVNKEIEAEIDTWHLHGIDPSGVNINPYLLDLQFFGLREFLVENGIINEDELELFTKKRMLAKFREIRPDIIKEVEKQRKQIVTPTPNIFGPDGGPLQ